MNIKLRIILILLMVLGFTIPGFAQNSIKGRVVDQRGDPLVYATVVLLSPADSTVKYYDVADDKGYYQIKYIESGKYIMQFSFVGMDVIYENVTIPSELGEDFGDKVMKDSENIGETVVITAERIPMEFKRDTVSFNARAFKTREGAVVEDLLKKIPGIEVDKNGDMKALGEDVTKVLVDGKEFFSGDPKVATKNLPAKAIDKVQVYDKKTEEAEFMGIEDGERDRTINLLLNEDHKRGYFGNEAVGGGTGGHYKVKGDLYRFSSSVQAAVLGMYNNINEFGFSGKGGQQPSGVNTTGGGGINLLYYGEKNNRYYISYLVNSTKTDLNQITSTENFIKEGSYYQDSDMDTDERNTPQTLRFGIHHKFNNSHNMIIRGGGNSILNKSTSYTFTDTRLNEIPVNNLDNTAGSRSDQGDFYVFGNDILKLNGNNTQLKTTVYYNQNKNTSELDWTNRKTIFEPYNSTISEEYQDNNTDNRSFSFDPTIVQKLGKFWTLNAGFNFGTNNRDLNRDYGAAGAKVDSLSFNFETGESFFRPQISLQRGTSNTFLNFSVAARKVKFDKILNNSSIGESDYFYFLPRISYRNLYRKGRKIEAGYFSSVGMPGLNQLLPVTNTQNQLSVYKGNPDLIPEYRHNVYFMWSLFDAFSFTSFFTRLNAGYTKDKISTSQTINEDLTKMNTPVNVPYSYYISSNSNFSTPIRSLGININAKLNELWTRGVSVINSEENIQKTMTHSLDLNFSNRRESNLDIRIGGSVSKTITKFSVSENLNNSYWNTSYYTEIYYSLFENLSLGTEAMIYNYNAESFKDSRNIPLVNTSVSYYFLEGGKAGFLLKGYDLLNKFTSFQQMYGPNYIMAQEKNTIGRYYMLSFVLRFGSKIGRGMARGMR
ncbi:outer membrane beta-barrel protein [candidate division KSB1 bacterium]